MKETLKEDFILICDDALDKKECDTFVKLFEQCKNIGVTLNRTSPIHGGFQGHEKSDESMSVYGDFIGQVGERQHPDAIQFNEINYGEKMLAKVYEALSEFYLPKWSTLPVSTSLAGFTWKIQKTTKGEGYHFWHSEASQRNPFRTLAWSVYLTDVDEDAGGETQFLYYPHSIKPKAGRLAIWPSQFTHTHRGNIYWGEQPKYIATGWLHYHFGTSE